MTTQNVSRKIDLDSEHREKYAELIRDYLRDRERRERYAEIIRDYLCDAHEVEVRVARRIEFRDGTVSHMVIACINGTLYSSRSQNYELSLKAIAQEYLAAAAPRRAMTLLPPVEDAPPEPDGLFKSFGNCLNPNLCTSTTI